MYQVRCRIKTNYYCYSHGAERIKCISRLNFRRTIQVQGETSRRQAVYVIQLEECSRGREAVPNLVTPKFASRCAFRPPRITWAFAAMSGNPLLAPIFPAGKEPLPPGFTEEDREQLMQAKKTQDWMTMGMESCVAKTIIAGGGGKSLASNVIIISEHFYRSILVGFGIGAFFSLMSASFAYEDPLLRQQTQAGLNTGQKAKEIFKDMGKGMWKSGKGFGKVGALFAGTECVIEGVSIFLVQSSIFTQSFHSIELKMI